MKKRILFLMNAQAGTGQGQKRAMDIVAGLVRQDAEVVIYPVLPEEGLGSEEILEKYALDMFQGAEGGFDCILCCGGDGTLHHVANALIRRNIRTPVLYMPSGTTNDFAKALGLPEGVEEACRLIRTGRVFACDAGQFNEEYFNYVAAFGAFTAISYNTNQTAKNVLGYAAYVLSGLLSLPDSLSYRCHMVLWHDGTREEGEYLFGAVSNTTSMAGIQSPMLSEAEMDDGEFEVILVRAPENGQKLLELMESLARGNYEHELLRIFKTREIRFHSYGKVDWTLDGEYGGSQREVHIQVVPEAVNLLLPPTETGKS